MPDPHGKEKMAEATYTNMDDLDVTAYEKNLTHYFGVDERMGSTDLNMHIAYVEPGQQSRAHFHLRSDVAYYVLEGEATMITWNQNFERTEHLAKKGEFAFVPRGTIHKNINNSGARFGLIACYNNVGTGPESLKVYTEDAPVAAEKPKTPRSRKPRPKAE